MNIVSWNQANLNKISETLLKGEPVVVPTDTLYGMLAIATKRTAVGKVYQLKKRTPSKPFIILISDITDLNDFGVIVSNDQKIFLEKYWPGKVSVILPCPDSEFDYLHRGTNSLAFRLPDDKLLRELIKITGPLIAPSANTEGGEPATDITMAQEYFEENVDLYVDGGERLSEPSTLVSLTGDKIEVLRGKLN